MIHPARQVLVKPPRGTLVNSLHPLSKGLVGCWLLNEGSGSKDNTTLAFDSSGNGRHALLRTTGSGGAWGAGKDGITWVGSDDSIFNLGDISFGGTSPISLVVSSMKISSFGGDDLWLVCQGTEIVIRIKTTGEAEFILNSFATNDRATSTSGVISTGTYYNIAGVYDGSKIYIYVDGIEKASVTPTGSYADDSTDFAYGGISSLDSNDGPYGSLYIYNRGLTAQEVLSLHNKPYQIFEKL